jgi:hypothetical protein
MTRDRNTFRTGTAKYSTEEEVWDFLDSGTTNVGFQEIWEHTENELGLSMLPGTGEVEGRVSETGANQVRPAEKFSGTEDEVDSFLDRFPGNGL